jgi:hypothetical protein
VTEGVWYPVKHFYRKSERVGILLGNVSFFQKFPIPTEEFLGGLPILYEILWSTYQRVLENFRKNFEHGFSMTSKGQHFYNVSKEPKN